MRDKVQLGFSRPGKPKDNAFIELFSGKFRQECLNREWFGTLDELVRHVEAWRSERSEIRPGSSPGNLVTEYMLPRVIQHNTRNTGRLTLELVFRRREMHLPDSVLRAPSQNYAPQHSRR
jgi:putative transposase